jgi:hypothetical protein
MSELYILRTGVSRGVCWWWILVGEEREVGGCGVSCTQYV